MTQRRSHISTLGWEIQSIVASSPNFRFAERVHYTAPKANIKIVIQQVEQDGLPLIIAGWNRHPRWPKSKFTIDWLKKHGDQNPTVRNVHNWADITIPIDDLIRKLRETPRYASPDEHERLYGKDVDCPAAWAEWLESRYIPEDLLFDGPNDFLKFLPDEAKVQTLMCYMGIGDTFTPFHKDLCASSGQNLMCFSEHSGSAFWFMTKSSAAPEVAAYFHQLGQEVDLETHVVTIEELARAPFDVYIAEQQLGDLVLVPPRSCHQVVNKGGITIKTSWSRMSLNGLRTALWHELPIYHRVCRQEIYKVKSNIFHALQHFTRLTEGLPEGHESSSCPRSAENILQQLVSLFDDVLTAEISISRDSMPHVSHSGVSHTDNLHCDFCGADIFQSFFECPSCLPASSSAASTDILQVGDGLILCPLCYMEGRACLCEGMQPVQCRPFSDLLEVRDQAVRAIQRIDSDYIGAYGYLSDEPLRLLSGRDANIFEAACKLFQKRQNDTKTTRNCRVRAPHPVTGPEAIYCKSCHFSKCYTHLLELDSVHSVDVITLSDRHDGDANWHQFHRDSSHQYQEVRQRAIGDEEMGLRPNLLQRLVYLAKTFTTCRAIRPEATKHGWYDRFAQTTSIPIAQTPAKALAGLPDNVDNEQPSDGHAVDESPSRGLGIRPPRDNDLQTTDSLQISTSALPGGSSRAQSPRESSLSPVPDSPSPVVDSVTRSPELSALETHSSPAVATVGTEHDPTQCDASSSAEPVVVASLSSTIVDDTGNLSDLTDLTTELGSPPRNSVIPETVNQWSPVEPHSSSPVPATVLSTRFLTESLSKPRPVFDGVEIPQPDWYIGRREKFSLSSGQKRKRASGPLLSGTAGAPGTDNLPSSVQEISGRTSSEKRRKMSQGPASRLPRFSERTRPLLAIRDQPSPRSDGLANALNQTFQFNSTSAASHVTTPPRSLDHPALPVSSVISPTVKPQYRDIGVQKSLNFTRNSSTSRSSEADLSSCIVRLETENRELRTEAEVYKHQWEACCENLEEIQRRYTSSSSHQRPPVPPGRPSDSTSYVPQELSTHPRWRVRNIGTDSRTQTTEAQEPRYPPIETLPLPSPSSPECVSPTARRRPPTEPRSHRMRRRMGDVPGSRAPPYPGAQQHGRKRGLTEPVNGRQLDKVEGPLPGRSREVDESPVQSNSSAGVEAGVFSAPPKADMVATQDHDKVNDKAITAPPSPLSTASDQQPTNPPVVP